MKVLVTGASGFLGNQLISRLITEDVYKVLAAYRKPFSRMGVDTCLVADLAKDTHWVHALAGVDVLIHTSARVHVMNDMASDPLAAFRAVNVDGTLNLARQAADAGVRRFVFISSIKVNGESTKAGRPFMVDDCPSPIDAYGISKMEAELGLREIASQSGMEVVIIRPPLVYGPGVKGNFLSMMRWLHRGVPLPFGAINNSRSLVALDNLVDLIVTCLHHPAAANQTFLVSDGEDISTTKLLKRTALAMEIKARLIPVPTSIIQTGAWLLGKRDVGQRLCGSLQVNITKTRELLGWTPPVTVDQALRKTAVYFLRTHA